MESLQVGSKVIYLPTAINMFSRKQTLVIAALVGFVSSFNSIRPLARKTNNVQLFNSAEEEISNISHHKNGDKIDNTRKAFLTSLVVATTTTVSSVGAANADEGFESIAARAAKISKLVEVEEAVKEQEKAAQAADLRTVYDFSLPMAGVDVPFKDLVKQEFATTEIPGENEGEVITKTEAKVKAILVVNIKQDDPIARRNIPELISLAAK